MKQTSTQLNVTQDDNTTTDILYHAYFKEYINRGVRYQYHRTRLALTLGQKLRDGFLLGFMIRISLNPSLFTVLTKTDPYLALTDMLYADDNEDEKGFIVDMLDDLTVNVKIRCKEAYDECMDILEGHLNTIIETQTNMSREQRELFDNALNLVRPYLVTLHYLRKIGYQHEFEQANFKQEEHIG